MKRLLAALTISLFTSVALSATAPCSNMVFGGVFPQSKEPVTIICKTRFVIGYSIPRKNPLWVAEVLTSKNIQTPHVDRRDNFRPDPVLPPTSQASLIEFIATGLDRGHMVPFEDMADDPKAADESFIMTNMIPQAATMNRGIWRSLEMKVRKLALQKGTIYVITGPIFDNEPQRLKFGTMVPAYAWKVVLVPATREAFTAVVPNQDGLSAAQLPKFASSLSVLHRINPNLMVVQQPAQFVDKPLQ